MKGNSLSIIGRSKVLPLKVTSILVPASALSNPPASRSIPRVSVTVSPSLCTETMVMTAPGPRPSVSMSR